MIWRYSYRCVELLSWLNEPRYVELSLLQSGRETKDGSHNFKHFNVQELKFGCLEIEYIL